MSQPSVTQAVAFRPAAANDDAVPAQAHERSYVTLMLGSQLCGVPVLNVREVITDSKIVRVPLAPPQVAGNINLRGRIVTAIDTKRLLDLPPAEQGARRIALVAESGADLYALLIDQVLEVLTLPDDRREDAPTNLPAAWHNFSTGVFRLPDRLMVVLDVARLLALPEVAA
jgi:purine-binding chemotaxis protein CheW